MNLRDLAFQHFQVLAAGLALTTRTASVQVIDALLGASIATLYQIDPEGGRDLLKAIIDIETADGEEGMAEAQQRYADARTRLDIAQNAKAAEHAKDYQQKLQAAAAARSMASEGLPVGGEELDPPAAVDDESFGRSPSE